MNIHIKLNAQLRAAAGTASDSVTLSKDQNTLSSLCAELVARYGTVFSGILFEDNGSITRSVIIVVNGNRIADFSATKLSDGDEVMLLSPISGG
jgi:MoaD family protein